MHRIALAITGLALLATLSAADSAFYSAPSQDASGFSAKATLVKPDSLQVSVGAIPMSALKANLGKDGELKSYTLNLKIAGDRGPDVFFPVTDASGKLLGLLRAKSVSSHITLYPAAK